MTRLISAEYRIWDKWTMSSVIRSLRSATPVHALLGIFIQGSIRICNRAITSMQTVIHNQWSRWTLGITLSRKVARHGGKLSWVKILTTLGLISLVLNRSSNNFFLPGFKPSISSFQTFACYSWYKPSCLLSCRSVETRPLNYAILAWQSKC